MILINNLYNKTEYFTILRSKTNVFDDFSKYDTIATNVKQSPYVDYIDYQDVDQITVYSIANNYVTENFSLTEYNEKTNRPDSTSGKISSFFNCQRAIMSTLHKIFQKLQIK